MNQIFLGQPVDKIKNWFISQFPSLPTYTTLKFTDGTTQTKEIYGAATRQNIFDEQLNDCGGDEKTETLVYCQLGNNVTEINNNTFLMCYSLTSIDIPNSVTSIRDSAFSNCFSLTSITIPNSVTSIGNQTFYYCSSLTSITIPNSVNSIGSDAFSGCRSLTSVTIPSSVISIGSYAFYGCNSLTSAIFEGRTSSEITAMANYPWNIPNTSAIKPGIS